MSRTITVRLLDGERDARSKYKVTAVYHLPEASIRRYPESLLGDALDGSSSQDGCVYHAEAKGQPGGITLSFYNRPAVVFDTAMQVITRGGLEGVNLAPLGSSVDAVLEELAGFWKLPFTMEDIHRAFRPSMVHHVHLMAHNDATLLWTAMQRSTMAALSSHRRRQLLNDCCTVFVVTETAGDPASMLRGSYRVQLITDYFITGPLIRDWNRCIQEGQLALQWTDPIQEDPFQQDIERRQLLCTEYVDTAAQPLPEVRQHWYGWDKVHTLCGECVTGARSSIMRGMRQQAQQEGFQLHLLELVLSADQDAGAYEALEVQTVHAVVVSW